MPVTAPNYSLLSVATTSSPSGPAGAFAGFASASGAPGANALETNCAWPWPAAGTIWGLTSPQATGPPSSGSWGLTLRKNGANATQQISDAAPSDAIHTDAVAAGDLIDLQWSPATTGGTAAIQAIFAPSGPDHWTNYASFDPGGGVTVSSASTLFARLWGTPGASSTSDAAVSATVNTPGTASGFGVILSANTAANAIVAWFKKNATNLTQTLNIGAGLTGFFQDTTHTDAIAAGDLISSWIYVTSSRRITTAASVRTTTDGLVRVLTPGVNA
jgi:hypothetical protein